MTKEIQIPKFTSKLYLCEFSIVSPNFSLNFNVLQDLWALSIFIAGQSSPTPPLKMFNSPFRLFHSLLSLSQLPSHLCPVSHSLFGSPAAHLSSLSASLRPFQALSFLHKVFTPPLALSSLAPSEHFPLNISQLPSHIHYLSTRYLSPLTLSTSKPFYTTLNTFLPSQPLTQPLLTPFQALSSLYHLSSLPLSVLRILSHSASFSSFLTSTIPL